MKKINATKYVLRNIRFAKPLLRVNVKDIELVINKDVKGYYHISVHHKKNAVHKA